MRRTPTKQDRDFPAYRLASEFLEKHCAGTSVAVCTLREEILSFCFDLSARVLMLLGPIGIGKTTIARMVGLLKAIAPLSGEQADRYLRTMKFVKPGLLDLLPLYWYVELPLPGLVESLAETQLFGIGKGRASGVSEKPGVFETAMTGHGQGEESPPLRTTGGVVFLDEIADLPRSIQPKLLAILAGDTFSRVGDEEDVLTYKGTTIVATWQDPRRYLRTDLFSRLADRIIEVPGLGGRSDDLPSLIRSIEGQLVDAFKEHIEYLTRDQAVSRLWMDRAANIEPLPDDLVGRLAGVDWERYANLRGLSAAIKALVFGERNFERMISRLSQTTGLPEMESTGISMVEELLRRAPDGCGLAGHVKTIELQRRSQLRDILSTDEQTRRRVANHLGLDPHKMDYQLGQLDRERSRSRRGRQRR
jgi:transcriptional regulator with AAA-type ATPase domain